MTYEQMVTCPVPGCGWEAAVVVEDWSPGQMWRDGVIRDALRAERVEHVRSAHVTSAVEARSP